MIKNNILYVYETLKELIKMSDMYKKQIYVVAKRNESLGEEAR
jgi:hypothetical protein